MAGAPWWEDFRALEGDLDVRQDTGPSARTVEPAAEPVAPQVIRRPPRGLQITAALLSVVFLALLGLLAVRTLGTDSGAASESGTPSGPPTTPVTTASASSADGTAAADAAALASLHALRDQGLAAHPIQGQWVAQLSAKSVGTTDPVQTAANGSSTFYPSDILAQSQEIASGIAGGDVFVLQTTDFGDALVDARGNAYWVTLAAGPFGDAGDVQTWCDSMFATTPAAERGNVCLPRRLTPP